MTTIAPEAKKFRADQPDYFDVLKADVWVDEDFRDFVLNVGLETALEQVHHFHRYVANQLIGYGIRTLAGPWTRRAGGLSIQVKQRRQELRAVHVAKHGRAATNKLIAELEEKYPRIPFGSLLTEDPAKENPDE